MSHIKLVKGDNRTVLTVAVTAEGTDTPANLAGASVLLHVRQAESTTDLFVVTGDLLTGHIDEEGNLVTGIYTVPGSGGRVEFAFPVGSLNVDAGLYEAAVEVIYGAGGGSQTTYDMLKLLVRE